MSLEVTWSRYVCTRAGRVSGECETIAEVGALARRVLCLVGEEQLVAKGPWPDRFFYERKGRCSSCTGRFFSDEITLHAGLNFPITLVSVVEPASDGKENAMDALDQDARVARALATDFVWSRTNAGTWICESPSGQCYTVTENGCTCPDWTWRCSKFAWLCKHMVALGHMLIAEGTAILTPPPIPDERAELDRIFDRIFG